MLGLKLNHVSKKGHWFCGFHDFLSECCVSSSSRNEIVGRGAVIRGEVSKAELKLPQSPDLIQVALI